jgi:hypothetical protein
MKFKFVLLSTFIVLAAFTLVTFNACTPDKCKNVGCAYSGVCKEGVCLCQLGYEGEHCETTTREKFLGIYDVNEDGTITGPASYSISISKGNKIDEVFIDNFNNQVQGVKVYGICQKDSLFIPYQMMVLPAPLNDTFYVSGKAQITDTNPLNQHYYQHAIMNFYYKITDINGITNEFGSLGAGPSIWAK